VPEELVLEVVLLDDAALLDELLLEAPPPAPPAPPVPLELVVLLDDAVVLDELLEELLDAAPPAPLLLLVPPALLDDDVDAWPPLPVVTAEICSWSSQAEEPTRARIRRERARAGVEDSTGALYTLPRWGGQSASAPATCGGRSRSTSRVGRPRARSRC
jgi:hypothetical protein